MTDLRWEAPPDPPLVEPSRSFDWPVIVYRLRQRPGEWAIVRTAPNANLAAVTAYNIRVSKYEALKGCAFEATARTVGHEHRVYARYMPEATS